MPGARNLVHHINNHVILKLTRKRNCSDKQMSTNNTELNFIEAFTRQAIVQQQINIMSRLKNVAFPIYSSWFFNTDR